MSLAMIGARITLHALRQQDAEMDCVWDAPTYLTVQRANIVWMDSALLAVMTEVGVSLAKFVLTDHALIPHFEPHCFERYRITDN